LSLIKDHSLHQARWEGVFIFGKIEGNPLINGLIKKDAKLEGAADIGADVIPVEVLTVAESATPSNSSLRQKIETLRAKLNQGGGAAPAGEAPASAPVDPKKGEVKQSLSTLPENIEVAVASAPAAAEIYSKAMNFK